MLKQKHNKSRDNLYTITYSVISSYNSMIIYTVYITHNIAIKTTRYLLYAVLIKWVMNSSLITEYLQLINYVIQQYNYHPILNQMYIFILDLKTLLIVKILPLFNWYDESVRGNGVGLKVFFNRKEHDETVITNFISDFEPFQNWSWWFV